MPMFRIGFGMDCRHYHWSGDRIALNRSWDLLWLILGHFLNKPEDITFVDMAASAQITNANVWLVVFDVKHDAWKWNIYSDFLRILFDPGHAPFVRWRIRRMLQRVLHAILCEIAMNGWGDIHACWSITSAEFDIWFPCLGLQRMHLP